MHHIVGMDNIKMNVVRFVFDNFRFNSSGIAHEAHMQIVKTASLKNTRNHYRRPEVSPHGVNGYDGTFTHYSASGLATIRRPLYMPQAGQTLCGSLGSPHEQ